MPEKQIELFLLGAPQLLNQGVRVSFDTRKALALLAYLAVVGQPQHRDTLAALLWPEQAQDSARGALRRTLSTLNKGFGGTGLIIQRETIGLEDSRPNGRFWADSIEFARHIKAVRASFAKDSQQNEDAAKRLEMAVALWQGEFMQGFSLRDAPEFEEWQYQTGENFKRELVWALEKLAVWRVTTGQLDPALEAARRWLGLDPLNEAAHRAVMQLLAWQNQTGLALKQYRECVRILEKELGVPPLEATTQLYQDIKEQRLEPFKVPSAPAINTAPTPASDGPVESEVAAISEFPLVGREREKLALEKAFQANHGHIIVVEGEAGVGKTRLVEEFLAGRRVTRVNCYEGETEMAFLAINTALHNAFTALDETGQQRLESLPAVWRREAARLDTALGAGLSAAESLDTPGAQGRFFEGLRQTLLTLVGEGTVKRPGLLFFDDLQWMDGASLDFLNFLANRIAETSLGLVLTWRSGTAEARPALAKLLTVAQRANRLTHLNLARLGEAEVKLLVAIGLPNQLEMTALLYSETEGLPLFIIEYIKAFQRGGLEIKAAPEEKPAVTNLPVGVQNLLESRLRSLSEPAQQLLHSAAVIGRSFDYDTLREVSGRSDDETVTGLEELTGAGVVTEAAAGSTRLRYDFSHEKLRGIVYEKTSLARRRLLHRRTAEVFANQKTTGKEQLYAQAAFHYRQAREEGKAAGFYSQAGDYARSLFANREALTDYQEALMLGHPDTDKLHENLGDLYTRLGEYTLALHQFLLAGQNARLDYKIGKVYLWRGDWKLAINQFEMVNDLAGLDENLQAQLYTDWGLALHRLDQDDEAYQLAEKALEQSSRNHDLLAQAHTYNFLGLLAGHRRETALANELLNKSLRLSQRLDDQALQAAALNNLAWVSRTNREFDQAISLTRAALEIVTSQGDRHRQAALLSNLGDLYQETGQPEKARDFVRQSILIYAEIGVEAGAFQPGIWMLTEW